MLSRISLPVFCVVPAPPYQTFLPVRSSFSPCLHAPSYLHPERPVGICADTQRKTRTLAVFLDLDVSRSGMPNRSARCCRLSSSESAGGASVMAGAGWGVSGEGG